MVNDATKSSFILDFEMSFEAVTLPILLEGSND